MRVQCLAGWCVMVVGVASSCTGAGSGGSCQAGQPEAVHLLQGNASTDGDGGPQAWTWSGTSSTNVTGTVVEAAQDPNADGGQPVAASGPALQLRSASGRVFGVEHRFTAWEQPAVGSTITVTVGGSLRVSDATGRTLLVSGSGANASALGLPPELSLAEGGVACEEQGSCGKTTFQDASVTADGQAATVHPGEETSVGAWRVRATIGHHDAMGTTCPSAANPVVQFHAFRN